MDCLKVIAVKPESKLIEAEALIKDKDRMGLMMQLVPIVKVERIKDLDNCAVECAAWPEPQGSKIFEYSDEESDGMRRKSALEDENVSQNTLSVSKFCKVCSMVSVDCKCVQHPEGQSLPGNFEDSDKSRGKRLMVRPLLTHLCNNKYICDICGKPFVAKTNLELHRRIHGQKQHFVGKVYDHLFSKRKAVVQCRGSYEKNFFSCTISDRSVSRNVYTHNKILTEERFFSCEHCRKSFSSKKNLILHLRSHSLERPFNCKLCTKSFNQRSNLVVHIRSHTGERPFNCEQCRKSFTSKQNLVLHLRTHTGERPFNCEQCRKSFNRRSHLVMHIRSHTGERPFNCKLGLKSCSQRSSP